MTDEQIVWRALDELGKTEVGNVAPCLAFRRLTAASAIDGDYDAGIDKALEIIRELTGQDGMCDGVTAYARIEKLKKVTP